MRYLELIGGLALYPEKYVTIIVHEDRSFIEPLFTVLFFQGILATIFSAAASSIVNSVMNAAAAPALAGLLSSFMAALVPIATALGLFAWFIWSLATHILAKLFGGSGDYIDLLKVMGYTWFTLILPIVMGYIYPLSPLISIAATGVFTLAALIWFIYINYHAVKEIYGIPGAEALLSLIIPIIILATIPFLPIAFLPRW